jgi:hypothetical protein
MKDQFSHPYRNWVNNQNLVRYDISSKLHSLYSLCNATFSYLNHSAGSCGTSSGRNITAPNNCRVIPCVGIYVPSLRKMQQNGHPPDRREVRRVFAGHTYTVLSGLKSLHTSTSRRILSAAIATWRRSLGSSLELLTTYTHHLQAITATPLISKLYKSLLQKLSLLHPAVSSIVVSW